MNSRLIEKIRALADDPRGDPNIRAIAQRKLTALHETEIKARFHSDPRNPPNPRTQPSKEYAKFQFMNMDNWGLTVNDNPTYRAVHNGRAYRFVIFKYKKTTTWGWIRLDAEENAAPTFSKKFSTLDEARRDAWDKLMTL